MYVLPNRKAFSDAITRIFLNKKYRKDPTDDEDKDIDLCQQNSSGTKELFPYQKLVRDYLATETPYRGLLLYHGLGSGKTCSSIAVAESVLSPKKIFVLAKKALIVNFKQQLRECGDPIYQQEQHWETKNISSEEDREKALSLGITQEFIDNKGRYFITVPNKPSNFKEQALNIQKEISEQIDTIINKRFEFIKNRLHNEKNVKFSYIWGIEEDKNFYHTFQQIIQATNGKVIDTHFSFKGHLDFAHFIYNKINTKII